MKYISEILEKVEKMVSMVEIWPQLGSLTGSLVAFFAIFYRYFYPYVHIKFDEYGVEQLTRSDAYVAIENYLVDKSTREAKILRAVQFTKDFESVLYRIDENEEVTDEFEGLKVWWSSKTSQIRAQPMFSSNPERYEKRYFKLTFHKSNLDSITKSYVTQVLKEGKDIALKKRDRKLYLNNPSRDWQGSRTSKWTHLAFEHPATFDTLALDPKEKSKLKNDLNEFRKRRTKEYYRKIGKAWKRGYLLYGPPGTGKSTTIAAMANFLEYDVYDLELTTVKDNSELKKLMIETSSKSIIVIEDIDCSLDLTGQRKKKKKKEDKEKKDPVDDHEEEDSDSKVTLSGLLNSIDGLWSACEGERIIVFTTNFKDKLDPALIRKGRMDMHIELFYCRFEAFKVLAKNYLGIESHELFDEIGQLLKETNVTPADVADNLMPQCFPLTEDDDAKITLTEDEKNTYLKNLIEALENANKDHAAEARKKAVEKILHLLEKIDMNPADVAEKLMRKSDIKKADVETCLKNLIKALETAKEEKVRSKAEKEGKEKEQSARKDVEGEESSAKEVKESDFEDVKGNNKIVAKEENENGVAT